MSGTAFPGWYVTFQAAVLQQLPRPDVIDKMAAESWSGNQSALKTALTGALLPPQHKIAKSKRFLTPFRTIISGGKYVGELVQMVTTVGMIEPYAHRMIANKDQFKPSGERQSVDLVILTPSELGFSENPRIDAFLAEGFCDSWSRENLNGQAIELCRAEDGPHLRAEYLDQPIGENLLMAMECIVAPDGRPYVFGVKCDIFGARWLVSSLETPDALLGLNDCMVFRLRKLA